MLSDEDVNRVAEAVVEKAMEDVGIRDIVIGSAMGKGAIPLYGRETRKEPCACCLIDPEGSNTPENRMCTTKGAIGTLNDQEERDWCSEIVIVPDGRCARARAISEAARECKEKHPEDTEAFFRCYIPAFSQTTKGGNPNSEIRVEIGSSVCDRYTGSCGRIVDILDDEVLIEPTTLRKGNQDLETTEPPIRVKKVDLAPDHIRQYESAKSNPGGNPKTKYLTRFDPALGSRYSEWKVFDSPDEASTYAETFKAKMLPGDVVTVREGIGFEYKVIYRYKMPLLTKESNPGGNPMGEVIPPEPEKLGREIAKETGLRYDGVQVGLGLQFTDIKGTGTTFCANTLEEAKALLAEKRRLFAAARRE